MHIDDCGINATCLKFFCSGNCTTNHKTTRYYASVIAIYKDLCFSNFKFIFWFCNIFYCRTSKSKIYWSNIFSSSIYSRLFQEALSSPFTYQKRLKSHSPASTVR